MRKHRGVFERDGCYWVEWYDHQGHRHREKAGTFYAAKTLYLKRKSDALLRRKLPELESKPRPTFKELADDCLAYSRAHKLSYYYDTRRMMPLVQAFGSMSADEVTAQRITRWLDDGRAQGRSAATLNRYHALLSLTFRLAVENGKVATNPAAAVKRSKENNQRVRFLSADEETRLRAAILNRCPDRLPQLDIALNTGLRQGAQFGLLWSDVDLERGVITIRRSKPGEKQHVRMNDVTKRAFEQLRKGSTDGLVFGIKRPREWFASALKAAAIEDFTWHDLRHTVASRAVMAGASLYAVQDLLGHKNVGTTQRYSHLAPEFQQSVVDLLVASKREFTAIRTATKRKAKQASH